MVEFISIVAAVALAAAFFLGLAVKWGWLEWLQVHAPSEFFSKLFNCKFCCSFWMGVLICVTLFVITGKAMVLLAPVCTTVITRDLW